MSRRTKLLIWIPVGVLLVIVIAALLVLSRPVQTAIVHRIVRDINDGIKGSLTVGSVHVTLRGMVLVNAIAIQDPDGNPVGSIDRLAGRLSLWSLRSRTVRIHSLDLDNMRFTLVMDSSGRTNLERALAPRDTLRPLPDTTDSGGAWELFLDNISIRGGPALIHNPTDTLLDVDEWTLGADAKFKERRLEYAVQYDSPKQVYLNTEGAMVFGDTLTGFEGKLHLRVDSTYSGGYYSLPANTVGRTVADMRYTQRQDSMDFETAIESSVLGSLRGTATMMFPPGKIAGRGDLTFERMRPASLWKDDTALELNGRLRFDKDSSQAIVNGWDIRLSVRDTRYAAYDLEAGELRIVTADSTARITGDLDTGSGRVAINAFVNNFDPARMDVTAHLRLNRLRLHHVISQAPESLSPLTGTINVQGLNVASNSNRQISAVAHLDPFTLGQYEIDTLNVRAAVNGNYIIVDTVTVRGYGMNLEGEAEGHLKGNVSYAVRGDIPDLRNLEPLLHAVADTLDSLQGAVSLDLIGVADLSGGLSNLTASGDLYLTDVSYGPHYVKTADVRLVQYEMRSGAFALAMVADSITAAGQRIDSLDLEISGAHPQYTASIDAWARSDSMFVSTDLTASFEGATTVVALDSFHALAFGVEATSEFPTTLALSRDRVEVDALELRSNVGVLRASGYMQRNGDQDIVIEFSGVQTGKLAEIFRQPLPTSTTNIRVQFTGTNEDLVGDLELTADSILYDDKVVADQLIVRATADERITVVSGHVVTQNDTTGVFGGEFPLRISFEKIVELDQNAPINGRAKLMEQRLTAFSQFLPGGTTLDGMIAADVTFKGTPAQPQWLGQFVVRDALYRDQRSGVEYHDINLKGELIDDTLRIPEFTAESIGKLSGSGSALMAFPLPKQVDLQLQMNRFQILDNRDMRIRASGNVQMSGPLDRLHAEGRLEFDEVIYRLTGQTGKSVEDVNIDSILAVMRGDTLVGESAIAPSAIYRSMTHELHLIIPGNCWVRGQGLNIELGGELWMYKDRGAEPTMTGTIQTRQGRVDILGRRFEVVSGSISFEGPIGNPQLNVLAEYKPLDQTTATQGLRVRLQGNVQETRIEFEGMTPEEAVSALLPQGGGEGNFIQSAATGAATGQLTSFVGQWAGLDVFEYRPGSADGGLAGGTLEVGSYVTERLFVRVRQPVETGEAGQTGRIVNVEYRLLDWLKFRAEQEASSSTRRGGSALDLLFQFDWR